MSPSQLRATRLRLGFSQEGLGQIIGASPGGGESLCDSGLRPAPWASRLTISTWERGVNPREWTRARRARLRRGPFPIPRYAGFAVRFVEEHAFDLAGILAASDV